MSRKKSALENQARIDHSTIATLRAQLEAFNKLNDQSEEVDKRRVKDLKAVNDWLLRLALDTSFQDDLKRPLVNVALNCWGGTGILQSYLILSYLLLIVITPHNNLCPLVFLVHVFMIYC